MRHIAGMGMAVVGVALLTGCAVETVGRGPDAHVRYRDSSTVIVVDHPGYRVVHEPPPRHEQYRDERRERHEDRDEYRREIRRDEIRHDERRRDEGRPSFRRNDDRDAGREIRVIQRPDHSGPQNGNNGNRVNRGNNGNNGNNGKRPSKLDRRQHENQDNADQ